MVEKIYNVTSIAYSKSIIVSEKPIILIGLSVYNSGSAQFIQLHDAAAVPAPSSIPIFPYPIGTTGLLATYYGVDGRYFPHGLVITNSSTAPLLTIGADNCWFDIQVRAPLEK